MRGTVLRVNVALFPLPLKVPVTWLPMSGHRSWCPPQVHINTGRLCSAGSSLPDRSPTSTLVCSPPTPCPRRPPLRFPLRWPTSMRTLVLCPPGPTTRAPAPCRASEMGHRLSAQPGFVEERRGPPRLRGHPLRACSGRTPRRIHTPPCPFLAGVVVAFDEVQHSRHPGRL